MSFHQSLFLSNFPLRCIKIINGITHQNKAEILSLVAILVFSILVVLKKTLKIFSPPRHLIYSFFYANFPVFERLFNKMQVLRV